MNLYQELKEYKLAQQKYYRESIKEDLMADIKSNPYLGYYEVYLNNESIIDVRDWLTDQGLVCELTDFQVGGHICLKVKIV